MTVVRDRAISGSAMLLAGVILFAAGASAGGEQDLLSQASGPDLPNPPEIRSSGGRLDATLTAAPSRVTVAGRTYTSNVYDGLYAPPTLRLQAGEELDLTLINKTGPADVEITKPVPTNIHYHGTDVLPQPPGDNVFITVPRQSPDNIYHYVVHFPKDHPQGLHWYHPHVHGFVDVQILSGMSGMLIVDGYLEDHYPAFADARQRVMLMKGNFYPGQNQGTPKIKTINGLSNPTIRSKPGEYQVWMLGNLGADDFFNVALDGHTLWVIERDGNVLTKPEPMQTLLLPPGARATVVVRTGPAGTYQLRSLALDTGPTGLPNPAALIGTLTVAGPTVSDWRKELALYSPAKNIDTINPRPDEIRRLPITNRRTFTFSDKSDFTAFYINGKVYDENRVDTKVHQGDVEEWTLLNAAGELHAFHIHQTAFLVTEVNGEPVRSLPLRDVVNLPYAVGGVPGKVKIVIPFTNPLMVGEFVYHCHIVGHEDAGMMANIKVLKRQTAAESLWDGLRRAAAWVAPSLDPDREDGADVVPTGFGGQICTAPGRTAALDVPDDALQVSGLAPQAPIAVSAD